MMAHHTDEVIDLSDSYVLADHRDFNNVVIELDTDDSCVIEFDANNSVGKLYKLTES